VTTVVLIGDSHMEAIANDLAPLLARQDLHVVRAVASRGKSTAWYVETGKLGEIVAEFRPDIVVVELGTNDQPNVNYTRTLAAAVAQIRAQGSPEIIWFGPSYSAGSLSPRLAEIRSRQSATLPGLNVRWFDSWPMTRTGHGPDGIHFTRAGYQAWAEKMSDKIEVVSQPSLVLPLAVALAVAGGIFLAKAFFR